MTERFSLADTPLSTRFPIYTRANVGEVFPDPVTPLTSGGALWLAELGWRDAWERMGAFDLDEFPAEEFCQLGVAGGYCYLNASIIRLFGERAPGLSWQAMDEQFFGAQPGIPPYEEQPGDQQPAKTAKIGETFGWSLSLTHVDQLDELTDDRDLTVRLAAERPDLSTLTDRALFDRYLELLPLHRRLFGHHIFATYLATVPVGIISGVATAVGRPDLIMPIIAGIGDVDSAAPSHAMWDLGRRVAASASLSAAFDAGVGGLADRIGGLAGDGDADAAAFVAEFDAFLAEFGSRGPNEWESRSPTWGTRPELALAAIDRMRLAPDSMAPATQHAERAAAREAAAAELLAMVEADPETHGQLAAAVASSAAWLPGRERTKTNNIRMIHEMRLALRELGRRMVERGVFGEIEDFSLVTQDEYPAFLDAPDSLAAEIPGRRAAYLELGRRRAEFVFVGAPSDPAGWPLVDADDVDRLGAGDTLQGMPGCSGSAEGRARVVLDSFDPAALEPGDILVAPITDPSWTPLFVPSAAVVVDVGAPLSHAIIVSRELGIPCVISATDATRRIPDGALIRVDGDTGVVTILEVD